MEEKIRSVLKRYSAKIYNLERAKKFEGNKKHKDMYDFNIEESEIIMKGLRLQSISNYL